MVESEGEECFYDVGRVVGFSLFFGQPDTMASIVHAREAQCAQEMPVLRAVLPARSPSCGAAEGLSEGGLSQGPETSGATSLDRTQPGLLPGPVSLRQAVAGSPEKRSPADDTRRDTPAKAFIQNDFADAGRASEGDDTRRDPSGAH